MNAEDWEKLTRNMGELLEVYPSPITNYLYSKSVITLSDMKSIKSTKHAEKQMKNVLKILKEKPAKLKAFSVLIEALRLDPVTALLADKIVGTEAKSDANLHSKPDPHLLDEDVRRVLRAHYVNEEGSSTPLSDIRQTLKEAHVFGGQSEWDNDTLLDFIWKDEFVGVEIEKVKKRDGRHAKKVIYLKNIRKADPVADIPKKPEQREHQDLPAVETLQGAISLPTDVRDMTPENLKQYLTTVFSKEELPIQLLDVLEKQKVSGKIFISMKEEDFIKVIPDAPFGVHRFLTIFISKIVARVETHPEQLRKFDRELRPSDKYSKGHCVEVSANVLGKKTTPVRNFHLVEQPNKDKAYEFIGSEVIPFASACLNDRRNGTIYFGISPCVTQEFKAGEVVGVDLSKEEVHAELRDFITKCFLENQMEIIKGTVRDACFVPVTGTSDSNASVIEVDIVPSSYLLEDDVVRTKLVPLPIYYKKYKFKEAVFRFSDEGFPKIVPAEEMYDFERNKPRMIEQRKQEESQKPLEPMPNLKVRLLNLLTGGTDVIQDTIYPFMMLSPIDDHMNQDYLINNIPFIKHLHPEIVFDFDEKGSTDGIYKNLDSKQEEGMRVLTLDNFDRTTTKQEDFEEFIEGLACENRISWQFCNGYQEMSIEAMDPIDWNLKRSSAFQLSLKSFMDNFDKDRIIFIICLFSKTYKAMIEACDEVLRKLPDSWMVLAETEEIAQFWQDQMLNRNRVKKEDLAGRCVIGMPWEQVNAIICKATQKTYSSECCLPCSTGGFVHVGPKKLKDWCDINVLSSGDFYLTKEEKEKKKKEVEENFYKGEQVDWWNFVFSDQVLKRDIHDNFITNVKEALEGNGNDDDKVTIVNMLHQPGAGGTTSAKHVLWDLRKTYRCCVVNAVTKQTGEQLDEIRRYKDPTPKPILVFIDNLDDDKYTMLKANLEEKGRKRGMYVRESFDVYCTFIRCTRRASLPQPLINRQIALRQELTAAELDWFRIKHENLTSRFEEQGDGNVNPKFLISFNILRKNFNKDYIAHVVKEFLEAVVSDKEVKLLKIVSLLNTFDPDFKPIPVSCLDTILKEHPGRPTGDYKRNLNWEATLSQGVRVLLNLSSHQHTKGNARKSLRVFSKIIAQEILSRMKERTGQIDSELMQELLDSDIFQLGTLDSQQLLSIITNVFKKREVESDGVKRFKYSRFILHVKDKEGDGIVIKQLERVFSLNKDPFTAQLIARFYIEIKEWTNAEKWAIKAINMRPDSSFLWDTYGQVYKSQLFEKTTMKTVDVRDALKGSEIHELINLTNNCLAAFRREQQISELETSTFEENNFAGYFGELRAIVMLLNLLRLSPCFKGDNTLHKFLVDPHFKPAELNFLSETESTFLKTLESSSKDAMRRLDDEYLQMKENKLVDKIPKSFDEDRRSLLDIKVNLDEYFGEPTDEPPGTLPEPVHCEYRSRRARLLGASSLNSLLNLRRHGERQKLLKIFSLIACNLSTRHLFFDDIRTALDIATVFTLDRISLPGITFPILLQLSQKLYSYDRQITNQRSYLEAYLYFVLYNFPTRERLPHNICLASDLIAAIDKWRAAFSRNYPKSGLPETSRKRRETTLFFLGNGQPLNDIVFIDTHEMIKLYSVHENWQSLDIRQRLRLHTGVLGEGGNEVTFNISGAKGNALPLKIPTAYPMKRRNMFQKKINFYIGFSFCGPKAFGMSSDEHQNDTLTRFSFEPPVTQRICKSQMTLKQMIDDLKEILRELGDTKLDPNRRAALERRQDDISKVMRKLIDG